MKEKMKKLYAWSLKWVPVCACVMLAISANTTSSWFHGQDVLPADAKKYRKF